MFFKIKPTAFRKFYDKAFAGICMCVPIQLCVTSPFATVLQQILIQYNPANDQTTVIPNYITFKLLI